MSDIALVQTDDGTMPAFDFAIVNGDLLLDDGLQTPVVLSLFTDKEAATDDVLPDARDTDRRGCWADMPVADGAERDLSGSLLWLLERAKALTSTETKAKHYSVDALQWLISDGVVRSVTVEPSWTAPGFLALPVTLSKSDASGDTDIHYDLTWKATV